MAETAPFVADTNIDRKTAEYIITFEEKVDEKYKHYILKRVQETGLSVELVSHDNTLDFLSIRTTKQWLVRYLSTEEHLEEYLAIRTRVDDVTAKLDEFEKLPKSAMLPSSLNSHIIYETLERINIDAEWLEMVKSDGKLKRRQLRGGRHHLVDMDKLITICSDCGLIADIFPMTEIRDVNKSVDANKTRLWNLFFNLSSYFSHLDHTNNLDAIRDYYGEEIAFYFAFMDFYAKWLLIPGICGFAVWFYHMEQIENFIDESKWMPFFALFVCIWSHFMIKYWNRRASELALKWNTISFASSKYLIQSDIRPQFYGEIRESPITGKPERYYPAYKRYPKFVVGLLLSLLLLSLVFAMMICSLNLQGYIHSYDSILYIEYFNALSKPHGLFDKDSRIMWIVPTLMHCLFVFCLNHQYSKIASKLSEWENWQFQSEFENSLILKRFLFEFMDAFLPLFYICFYEMNMDILTDELFGLFLCDEIRRITTESIIPLLMHLWQLKQIDLHESAGKHIGQGHNVLVESKLDKYQLFDDYLEMIIQFGYITLFASCYPLAAILAFISNLFEIWSDSFKLCFLSQRPNVERAYNIHSTWILILQFMAWFSILTNCYIFAFSSEQLDEWLPSLKKTPHDGAYVVLIMFGLEHVVGCICAGVHYLISDITNHVDIQLQRKQHALYHDYIDNIRRKRQRSHKNLGQSPPTGIKKEL